jgi:hypothetical protein
MLTIASKDLAHESDTYIACSAHMQRLLGALVIGTRADVEAAEALLLLAEWTPPQHESQYVYGQNAESGGSVGRGEEDRAAWMYVGMALRVGYYLGIDATSFRSAGEESRSEAFLRERLAWAGVFPPSPTF